MSNAPVNLNIKNPAKEVKPIPFTKADIMTRMEKIAGICDKAELLYKEMDREMPREMASAYAMVYNDMTWQLTLATRDLMFFNASVDSKMDAILPGQ